MMRIKPWLLASRPKTLTGAAAPVLLGLALAWNDLGNYQGGHLHFAWLAAVLCLLFALLMQIDSNLVNDYFDYIGGIDDRSTRLGPERACASGWVTPEQMRRAIALVTVLSCAVGLPLVFWGGLEMLAIGLFCVVFCFLYSVWGARHGMGDLMVVLFFGLVPVATVYYIQLHTVTVQVWLAALAQGLVTDCLLLVNNYRDVDTDRQTGKRTLVVLMGRTPALWAYLLLGFIAAALVWPASRLSAPYLVLHLLTWNKMRRTTGRALNQVLGHTALCILLFAILTSIGILI